MKIWPVTVMTLSLAFAGSGAFSHLRAQDAAVTPDTNKQRCVNWMKATVPVADLGGLDAADFCSGIENGNLGGWSATGKCGASPALLTGTAPKYCASWGEISAHEAWAAGFSSTTKDGRELLEGASDSAKDAQRNAVTFYSRTAVWMGSLRVPAGMYQLTPSRSPAGWSLAVARVDGEWNDAKAPQQFLGTVEMKGVASGDPTLTDSLYFELGKDDLEIWAGNFAAGCEGRSDFRGRELHFILGTTDLLLCIRPEHLPASQETNSDLHGSL
jgi:hypothetical protein